MPDLRLGNVFRLPSRRISRRWTRSGTNLVIILGALCAQNNLFWREMKIKKIYLKSNTRQENFRTFEERDTLNGIKSDQLPAEKTSLRAMVLPVKSLCVLSSDKGFQYGLSTERLTVNPRLAYTPIKRTVSKSSAKTNYRSLTEINSRRLRTLAKEGANSKSLQYQSAI